ncbi:MAG: rhomboid family intramembrane serine protease [Treponema sp.]|jgi:membrane associated rhomboid family serine protease|nr:rhomboid family intramembrane serine protease [Treponema sp.]
MNSLIRKPFRYSYNGAVFWIIGINVVIFAAMRFLGEEFLVFLYRVMPMRPFRITQDGWVWTFITYMFMHGNFGHILFNMLALFIFGVHVERQMGSKEFVLYYLATGALAGVFSFVVYYFMSINSGYTWEVLSRFPEPYRYGIALVGASGAIFAIELAYAVFFPDSIIYIWGILPLRAPVMVLGFTALELFFTFTGGRGNTAHITHLAGFLFGWIYFLVRYGINPWRRLTRRG